MLQIGNLPVSYTHLDVYKRQEQVVDVFQNQLDANLVYVDATDRFLDLLDGVAEPEAKRKIIGAEFIRVFEEEARKVGDEVSFLAQGTICLLYTSF